MSEVVEEVRVGVTPYPEYTGECVLRASFVHQIPAVCPGDESLFSPQLLVLLQQALRGRYLLRLVEVKPGANESYLDAHYAAMERGETEMMSELWGWTPGRWARFTFSSRVSVARPYFLFNSHMLLHEEPALSPVSPTARSSSGLRDSRVELNCSGEVGFLLVLLAFLSAIGYYIREKQSLSRVFTHFLEFWSGSGDQGRSFPATLVGGLAAAYLGVFYGNVLKTQLLPIIRNPFSTYRELSPLLAANKFTIATDAPGSSQFAIGRRPGTVEQADFNRSLTLNPLRVTKNKTQTMHLILKDAHFFTITQITRDVLAGLTIVRVEDESPLHLYFLFHRNHSDPHHYRLLRDINKELAQMQRGIERLENKFLNQRKIHSVEFRDWRPLLLIHVSKDFLVPLSGFAVASLCLALEINLANMWAYILQRLRLSEC